jgi:hypothetical protein
VTCHCVSAVPLLFVMIRQLESTDVEACTRLRQQALLESPLAFGSSPSDDVAKTVEGTRELLGRQEQGAVFAHARKLHGVNWVEIAVTSAASEARRLYEKMGFVLWGTEPGALRYEGEATDLHFLTLRLDRA